MVIVASYDWESDSFTQHGEAARQAWREAVAEVAEKAKATLPECNGRVDSAVKMVLAGDVELQADGTAKVASQSNGTTAYFVVNGECQCKDFPKAPSNWCKHRIAAGIQKRAMALAKTKLDRVNGASQPPAEHAQGEPVPALPEAPASCNVYVTLAGRKVQVTLRDSDERRLLARLEALLQRFPAESDSPEQAQPEGWCAKHGVQMRQNHKDGRSWWSHRIEDGWCKGR